MKKVLLTSTALVMTSASFAAAEIAISGSAEMGVVGGNVSVTTAAGDEFDETVPLQFFNDVDVTFSMSGETDGGLAFGVSVDLDEAGNLGDEFDNQGVAIFISGDFGTLTMGDTDGALDFVMFEANGGSPGSLADDETGHPGYLGSYHDGAGVYDGQIVRYDYTFQDFTVAVSVEQPGGGDGNVETTPAGFPDTRDIDPGFAIGGQYNGTFNGVGVGVGVGYQVVAEDALGTGADSAEIFGVSGQVTTGGLTATIAYTSGDLFGIEDSNHIGLGASYTFDAFTVHANYGRYDYGDDTSSQGFGLAAGYDLGGGAEFLVGYGDGEMEDAAGNTTEADGTFSAGLSFSF
jgi:outer membrane protein OmpU